MTLAEIGWEEGEVIEKVYIQGICLAAMGMFFKCYQQSKD